MTEPDGPKAQDDDTVRIRVPRRRMLHPDDQDRLRHHGTESWEDDAGLRMSLAHAAVRAGQSLDEMLIEWRNPRHAATSSWREMEEARPKRALRDAEQCFRKATSWRANPVVRDSREANMIAVEVTAWADRRPDLWKGKSGQLARDVLDAIIDDTIHYGRTRVGVSTRSLSVRLLTGSPQAIGKGLNRLVAAGAIRRDDRDGDVVLCTWHPLVIGSEPLPLLRPSSRKNYGHDSEPAHSIDRSWKSTRERHVALAGLSSLAVRLYERLGSHPMSLTSLALSTGVTKGSASEALQRLVRNRLVAKLAEGWVRHLVVMDAIAHERSVTQWRETRSARYAREREEYGRYRSAVERRRRGGR